MTSLKDPDPKLLTCQAFRPITWDKNDTNQTIAEIKQHNAVWLELCKNPT